MLAGEQYDFLLYHLRTRVDVLDEQLKATGDHLRPPRYRIGGLLDHARGAIEENRLGHAVFYVEATQIVMASYRETGNEAHVERGKAYSKMQRARARKPRIRLEEGGTGLTAIVATLARRKDELGDPLPARDLWSDFYAELDRMRLDPEEGGRDEEQLIEYDYDDGRRVMKFASFKIALSRERAKLKPR